MKKKKLALRLAQILVVLVGISFVTFLLTYLSPGDPVRNMYTAAGIMPTEELVAETREELGLNDPLPTQYLRWLRNCLRGDFGKSYTLNKPVTELLLGRLWPTVKLTLLSMGLMLLLAVPLGMLSAVYKDRWIDYLVRGLTFVGCAMPNFWVGLLLMLVFGFWFQCEICCQIVYGDLNRVFHIEESIQKLHDAQLEKELRAERGQDTPEE